MGEYDRKQQKQESRAVAYNGSGSKQLKGVVDNRLETQAYQTKTTELIQMAGGKRHHKPTEKKYLKSGVAESQEWISARALELIHQGYDHQEATRQARREWNASHH